MIAPWIAFGITAAVLFCRPGLGFFAAFIALGITSIICTMQVLP